MASDFQIVVDVQEKLPLKFPSRMITTVREALDTGDYAIKIEGELAKVRVERKGNDLWTSFSGDAYRREKEKIKRAHNLDIRYIIAIESTCSEIRKGHQFYKGGEWHESGKDGLSQVRQLEEISRKYKVEIRYCHDRTDMSFMVQELLLTYWRNWDKIKQEPHTRGVL